MDEEKLLPERDRDFVEEILELIRLHRQEPGFAEKMMEYHPYDLSQALRQVEAPQRIDTFHRLSITDVARIFETFDDDEAIDFLREVHPTFAVAVIDHMETDDAVDLMQYLEDEEGDTNLVNLLSPKKREELKKYWSYSEDQAGSVMSTSYIEIPLSTSVKDAMKKVMAIAGETDYISILFIVDKQKLVGTLKLKQLIIARASDAISEVMETRFVSAKPTDDKEDVARLMQDYGQSSIPILEENGRMAGIVTHDVMMDIIAQVQSEDYAKLAGLGSGDIEEQSENVFSSVKSRLPWLMILLVLSLATSLILSLFEGAFSGSDGAKLLAARLAIFMPLILDMSGNTGTQSLAVMIRYLVVHKKDIAKSAIGKHLKREIGAGIAQGLMIGVMTFLVIYVSEGIQTGFSLDGRSWIYAIVTASAICLALIVANVLGALIPLLMNRLHFDPAVASGPFITTIADIVSLLVYYTTSLAFLLPLYL